MATYLAIDLKSFYASAECADMGYDPLNTNLVVADASRTSKTICLAVSPALKKFGLPGRPRLFEVEQRVAELNRQRAQQASNHRLAAWGSIYRDELLRSPSLKIEYKIVQPRMAFYLQRSAKVYEIYLRYLPPAKIHPYSIDEVMMDITDYLASHHTTAHDLAKEIIQVIQAETKITATAGIGDNLYLAKVAMDIVAKRLPPDERGARIAQLDELGYRRALWDHRPLTDFWRVGRGYARKLEAYGLYTMGDIARCSIGNAGDYHNEELLYKLFGVNAEILIDHAWGWEPCTIADVRAYKTENKSIVSGQVLQCPYDFEKARLVVREMVDALALDLVDKGLVTNQLVLTVGYDRENLDDPSRRQSYHGPVTTDRYGRKIPKHAVGTENFHYTSSASDLLRAVTALYDRIVNPNLLIRRLSISANKLLPEADSPKDEAEQLDLFTDYAAKERREQADEAAHARERKIQEAMLGIKKKYGKNAILKGMNLEEGATARERNETIGGHHA